MIKTCLFIIIIGYFNIYSQTDDIIKYLNSNNIFKQIDIKLIPFKYEINPLNGSRMAYGYKTDKDSKIKMEYYAPKYNENETSRGCFVLFGKKIILNKVAKNLITGLTFNMSMFNVFESAFKNRKYLLIYTYDEHLAARYYIFIFDITNKEDIKCYAFWSYYIMANMVGDFNKDSYLDVLEVRDINGQKEKFKITMKSLIDGKFVSFKPNEYYIYCTHDNKNDYYRIIKKSGFE